MKPLSVVFATCFAVCALGSPALAASQTKTASNGVAITVEGDEFKPRVDYTGPIEKIDGGGYFFAVRKMNTGLVVFMVQGNLYYDAPWRYYDHAYLPGGVPVTFDSLGREVGHCTRYGGCSLSETFQLTFTRSQISTALAAGTLRVQVGGRSGGDFVVEVPLADVRAAVEVAGVKPEAADAAAHPKVPS